MGRFDLLCTSVLLLSMSKSLAVTVRHDVAADRRVRRGPILMVSHGCSGTTGGYFILRDLLTNAVNESMAETGDGEVLKWLERVTTKEEIYQHMWGNYEHLHDAILDEDTVLERFKVLYEETQKQGKTMAFKVQLDTAMAHESLMDFIIQTNPRPFLFRRRNLLDVIHCRIADFCEHEDVQDIGFSVDEFGKHASCGEFRGREGASTREGESLHNVYIYPDRLVENLDKQKEQDFFHRWYLQNKDLGDFEVFAEEDLFLFEYDGTEEALNSSSIRWKALLDSISSEACSLESIKTVLRTYPKFPAPRKHKAMFYNFGAIKTALAGTAYYKMLRL